MDRPTLAGILCAHGDAYRRGHTVSAPQARAWRAIVDCRSAALGGVRERCLALLPGFGQRGKGERDTAVAGDPRSSRQVRHDLAELLTVAVCGVLCRADDFAEIEAWANERIDWLRGFLVLENGIPSHDTFARVSAPEVEAVGEIKIAIHRNQALVEVTWPVSQAAACAQWLHEILR